MLEESPDSCSEPAETEIDVNASAPSPDALEGGDTHTKRLVVLIPTHWEAVMGGAQYQAMLMMQELIERGDYDIHYLARRIDPDFEPTGYHIHQIGTSQNN